MLTKSMKNKFEEKKKKFKLLFKVLFRFFHYKSFVMSFIYRRRFIHLRRFIVLCTFYVDKENYIVNDTKQ